MKNPKILVIEDDPSILEGLEDNLRFEGYEVESVKNGKEGLTLTLNGEYDLVILDIMLPDMNGYDICKQLRRKNQQVPLIMLTARSQDHEKIFGFQSGADDYVTKPFSPGVLLARVKALLRRSQFVEKSSENEIRFGSACINLDTFEAHLNGKQVSMTALEMKIVKLFAGNPNRVLTRDEILDEAWDENVFVTPRTVDTHIKQLRKKLEPQPDKPQFFLTIHGKGYIFKPGQSREKE